MPHITRDELLSWTIRSKALERRRPTATGLDSLPSWFLELGAPIFSKPLAQLFNMSTASSTVPEQWKQAYIRPKVTHPKALADFRLISITPVLTRIMERLIVTQFLYPAFASPSKTPICLPANRISNGWGVKLYSLISNISHNLTATYRHTPAYRQSICYCNIVGLYQGVWFRSSLYIARQNGTTRNSRWSL